MRYNADLIGDFNRMAALFPPAITVANENRHFSTKASIRSRLHQSAPKIMETSAMTTSPMATAHRVASACASVMADDCARRDGP